MNPGLLGESRVLNPLTNDVLLKKGTLSLSRD